MQGCVKVNISVVTLQLQPGSLPACHWLTSRFVMLQMPPQVHQMVEDVVRRRQREREGGLSALLGSSVDGLMAAVSKAAVAQKGGSGSAAAVETSSETSPWKVWRTF